MDKWLLDDPIPSDEVLEAAWNEYLAKNDEKPLSNVERQLLFGEQLARKIARQQSDRVNATLGAATSRNENRNP
ncbi:XkdW family protein [Bacillus sp. SL00103]